MCQKSSRVANIAPEGVQHSSQGDPKSVQNHPGGIQNRLLGCPAKVSKTRSETKRSPALKFQANGSNMGPLNRPPGGIFDYLFNVCPASFLGLLFNYFFDVFVIVFFHNSHDLFGCLRVSF